MCKKVLAAIIAAALIAGAQTQDQAPRVILPPENHWYSRLFLPYEAKFVPPVSFENSPRLDSLIRAGKLYLSLQDAIALALENNLDIELQRFAPGLADADLTRTKGGAATRGIDLTITELPQGIGGPQSPLLNLPASGSTPVTTVPTSLTEVAAIIPATTTTSVQGTLPYSSGPPVPITDPAVVGALDWQHQTTTELNPNIAGSSALVSTGPFGSVGLAKGFSFGTQINATFNASHQTENSINNTINPFTASSLGLSLTQPLLRGFSAGVNRRYISIAKNDQKISDLFFRQQVIETVSGVVRLYTDLVSLIEDAEVKRETLALANRLYEDNKQKVEQGTLAPIELVRALAEVAAARQDLANSEGFEMEQELLMKNVLTKRGTADPLLREARIVATTPNEVNPAETVRPVQDLVADAFGNRPELQEAALQIENSNLFLKGSRNELLPEVDLVASATNSGLGGALNPLNNAQTSTANGLTSTPTANSPYVGGFGSALGQVLARNYPTYSVGIQLNLPIHNHVAEGDYVRDQMQLRQSQVRRQQLENQIRLQVESTLISLERARAAYEAAVEARKLQEQSLQIELERYQNGLSTPFLVEQYQSYVAQARSTEVAARGTYIKAGTELERTTGLTLENRGIAIADVMQGRIRTPPAPLPSAPSPAPGAASIGGRPIQTPR